MVTDGLPPKYDFPLGEVFFEDDNSLNGNFTYYITTNKPLGQILNKYEIKHLTDAYSSTSASVLRKPVDGNTVKVQMVPNVRFFRAPAIPFDLDKYRINEEATRYLAGWCSALGWLLTEREWFTWCDGMLRENNQPFLNNRDQQWTSLAGTTPLLIATPMGTVGSDLRATLMEDRFVIRAIGTATCRISQHGQVIYFDGVCVPGEMFDEGIDVVREAVTVWVKAHHPNANYIVWNIQLASGDPSYKYNWFVVKTNQLCYLQLIRPRMNTIRVLSAPTNEIDPIGRICSAYNASGYVGRNTEFYQWLWGGLHDTTHKPLVCILRVDAWGDILRIEVRCQTEPDARLNDALPYLTSLFQSALDRVKYLMIVFTKCMFVQSYGDPTNTTTGAGEQFWHTIKPFGFHEVSFIGDLPSPGFQRDPCLLAYTPDLTDF